MKHFDIPVGVSDFAEIRKNPGYEHAGKFFDIRKDSKELFEGLEIMENPALCKKWMNQWPVIFLSLKDVDGLSYEEAENAFVQLIGREAARFSFLREVRNFLMLRKNSMMLLT